MSRTKALQNKALVLEAFDTLFNKRDYVAAERYWSPPTEELDRGGHPPHRRWSSRRTLGRSSGRGHARGIQERSTHVRKQFHRVMP